MASRTKTDTKTRNKLQEIHAALGERAARKYLGDLSPEAYARALAGLTQQTATVALLEAKVAQWSGSAEKGGKEGA